MTPRQAKRPPEASPAAVREQAPCAGAVGRDQPGCFGVRKTVSSCLFTDAFLSVSALAKAWLAQAAASALPGWKRSEEHTSELQSRENLVCRLLLEKKKQILPDPLSFSSSEQYQRTILSVYRVYYCAV